MHYTENGTPFTELLRRVHFTKREHLWECVTIPGYVLHVEVRTNADGVQFFPTWHRTDGFGRRAATEGYHTMPGAVSWLVDQLVSLGVRGRPAQTA